MPDFDKTKFQLLPETDGFDANKFQPLVETEPKIPVSGYNQKTEEIISNIPDLSDGQKDVIRNLAKKGSKADVISNAILTLQGKHPIQSSIGKVEGNDDFRAFADIVTLGNANPKYYVEDDGTPVPLAKGVDAPKEKKVSNVWGSSGDTKDDSKLTTLAKNVWNIMPGVVENAADLIHLPYVLANTAFPQAEEWTDESGNVHNSREADWYKDFKSKIKTAQSETGEKYNAPIVKSENINKFTDLFDSKNYDINPDNVVGTIGSLVKSVGEFAVGGAGIGSVTNATTKGAKVASGFAASYMTQLGDVIDAAKESGLNTEDAYAFATAVTVPLALVDVNMGVEGRILSDAVAKGEKKALIKEIAKGVIKDADGKLTKEALDDAFKATLVANTALVKTWGKETVTDVLGEGGQEALQDFIQKSGEQLYDKLSGDPKFGTDAFSPESFGSYLNNAISGALGGMPTVAAYNKIKRIAKDNEQSKNAMGIISKGESAIKAFKVNVDEEVSKGFMTPEEGEIAKFKIDAYNEYNKQIGDLNIDQEEKRKVFDLSFQKQGLQTEVEGVDKDKLDPIELGKYEAKTKQIKDIQGEINDIITKSSVKDESVVGKKTITDLSKPVKKDDEKIELSPELQAINDRYKEETGFLPEKEVQRRLKAKEPLKMTEVKPTQFNEKRYNHREKFKQVAEHIDSTPEGRESGVLRVVDFTDPNGKKGKRIEVELPTGHRIWMSSSMAREGSDIMGHFREEHLPKNTSGKRAYEMMEGFPVKMKLVTTREGATGDNTAIKIYNAKTGKIIGWAKATTKGEDILSQRIISADQKFKGEKGITKPQYDAEVKRREDLAREEMIDRIEPVDESPEGGQLTTTPVTPKGPVKPPKQTTPKTKGEFVSSQIEKLKSEGDYDPSLQNFHEGHFGKQFDASNTVPEKTEKPKKGPEQSKAQKLYYKIRKSVRDNFEKYISGKKADSPEETGANSQEEYNDIVLRDSEVPSELAEAYLSAKNESVDDFEGTVEYAIYEFFSNSKNTISEAHFAKYGDPNFANRKDLPAIRTYVSEDGAKIDQVAQEMSTNLGQEVQVQDIIDFILNNPTGIKDYENSMKVSQKRALAKKFKAITGETLNDVTAKAIVDEIYGEPVREMDEISDEEAKAELEARKKAQEENPDELLQKPKKNEFEAERKEIEETAKKNGTWMKAPNGEKTKLSEKEWISVRTRAFKNWFGDWENDSENASKVLDENGEPLVSWHQNVFGENDFTEFKPQSFGTFGENSMFYFAKDKNWVKNFVKRFNPSAKQESRPFFLNIRKPLDLRNKNLTALEWIKYLSDNNLLTQRIKDTLEKAPSSVYYRSEIMPWQIFRYDNGEFRELLVKNGYDGIIQFDANYGKTNDLTTFVAISPSQIKSTANEGGFSEEEKNIYLQKEKGAKNNKEAIQKVIDVLKKSMPKVKVVVDENLTDKDGNPVAGKWDPKTNTVSVNPNYADTDTPIHEYGHVLIDAIGRNNKVIQSAIKQLQGTDLWKETKGRYPNLSESNLGVEVLAEAIGREGQGIFDTVAEQSRFKTFLDYIFDWFKTKLGLNKNIAKSLAKQIITGRGTKEMEGVGEQEREQIVGEKAGNYESLQRPKYKRAEGQDVLSLNDFRETELNRDVEKEKDDINYVNEIIKDKSTTDKERRSAEGLKNTILSRIREDKKKYVDYLDQVRGFEESMDKIVENDGLEDFTLDELLDIYHNSHYSMDNDSALNKAVKLRIATYLTKEQIKELEKNPLWEQKKGAVNKKDLSGIQLFFKSLADIPEYLPGVQVLGKELNRAALEKMKEIRERGEKLTKLAKAVIKEKNGKLGMLNPKGLFSSDSAKYFEYLDNGKGQLITKEEGKKLGITDAQMAYRDYMQELVDLRNATYDENDEIISNDLMKRDKGFREAWRTEGFLPALSYYLGRGISDDLLINVKNEQGGYDQKEFSDAQAEILSKTNTFSDKLKAGIKIAKLSYQGKKNKTDAPYMNYKGGLTMKYDKPRPKDKGYSKDFFASGLDLINDYAHVKHMGPLVPLFDSILYLHEKGFDSKLPNVKKFIESEMNDKLYQKQKGFEPTVDVTLRFLRRLGSLTTMAFNIPANTVNIFIGNYNNWRQEGLPHILKGNARLFSSDGKISDKGLDVLKQFDVIKFDAESNPQINGAKLFDKLAYFFNKIGEYQIQGSMFLGHMTDAEWDSFEKNESGEWVLKPGVDKKAFADKMMSYRDAVSSIQGKYDEKDRRMFMRGEWGKSVAQFKTWMPDWFKSRFGKEFINKYGVTEQGSVRAALRTTAHLLGFDVYTKEAIAELKKDFSGNPFNKNGTFKNKQTARNLRGAIAIATLYLATHSGDDDDKKKKKQYYETLSLDNALGNILFVIDPSQMKYLIENPVAVKGTITKFIDALDGALHGDEKKAKKNIKKLIPYNKIYDQAQNIGIIEKKK